MSKHPWCPKWSQIFLIFFFFFVKTNPLVFRKEKWFFNRRMKNKRTLVDRQENGNGLWLIWIFTKLFKRAGSSFTKNSSSKLVDHLTNNNNNILAGVVKVKLVNHKIRLIGSCRLICVKPLWSEQQKVDPKENGVFVTVSSRIDPNYSVTSFVAPTTSSLEVALLVFKTRWFIAGSFSRL